MGEKQTKKTKANLSNSCVVQKQSLTERLEFITGLQNASPPPTAHHHVTKSLFTAVLSAGIRVGLLRSKWCSVEGVQPWLSWTWSSRKPHAGVLATLSGGWKPWDSQLASPMGATCLGCQQNTPRSLSVKWQKIAGGGLPLCLSRCTSKKTARSDPRNILEDERHCVSFIPLTTFWYLTLFEDLLASGGGCHGSWREKKNTKNTSFKASAKGEVITVFSRERWLVSDTRGKASSPWRGTSDWLMSLTFPLHLCPNKCVQFEDWFHSFPIKATLT